MIQVKGLSLSFTKEYFALYNINLSIKAGERVALLGDSESGKTTLLRVIAGLEHYHTGQVFIKDINLKQIDFSKDVSLGYISHKPVFLKNKTVYDNLFYVLKIRHIDEVNAKIKINEALKYYQIEALRDVKVKTLSNFQKILVQFARLYLRKIEIYLIDDLFKDLAEKEEEILLNHIKDLQKQSATFLVATSKEPIAKELADKPIKLKFGSIIEE
jgi:ABC-type sugar transport system ATPase subunit